MISRSATGRNPLERPSLRATASLPSYRLSACLEWLFTEAGEDLADRIRTAADHGLAAVEFWNWRTKNIARAAAALAETGTTLTSFCTDPMTRIVDPVTHDRFLTGLRESVDVAVDLGATFLVITAGDARPGVPRDDQHAAIVNALTEAAATAQPRGITLLLENLNSRIDHIGTFCDSTAECIAILREVNSPAVQLLYDLYHSVVMAERVEVELADAMSLVGHVQLADAPGRHEPGTGQIDWESALQSLTALGYRGLLGLEYQPTGTTPDSLREIESLVANLAP